jgi:hypothetical protein
VCFTITIIIFISIWSQLAFLRYTGIEHVLVLWKQTNTRTCIGTSRFCIFSLNLIFIDLDCPFWL